MIIIVVGIILDHDYNNDYDINNHCICFFSLSLSIPLYTHTNTHTPLHIQRQLCISAMKIKLDQTKKHFRRVYGSRKMMSNIQVASDLSYESYLSCITQCI